MKLTGHGISFGSEGMGPLAEYIDAYEKRVPFDAFEGEFVPKTLEPRRKTARITKTNAGAFMIGDGIINISQKLRDVLVKFDLGETRLIKVSWINWDDSPSDRPPHYIFHVAGAKQTFIPEDSENLKQGVRSTEFEPRPDAPWRPTDMPDKLVVKASAAEGADIWHDPNLQERVFFSDRLRRAIEAAGLNARDFKLVEARVVD